MCQRMMSQVCAALGFQAAVTCSNDMMGTEGDLAPGQGPTPTPGLAPANLETDLGVWGVASPAGKSAVAEPVLPVGFLL